MTVKHKNAFFINLLFYKLQNVLILTTCFGHRMTIIRSTRAIMYMFLLFNDILLWKYLSSLPCALHSPHG